MADRLKISNISLIILFLIFSVQGGSAFSEPAPVVRPGSDPTAYLLGYAKYRNFTTTVSWEIYQGLDAGTGSPSNLTWDSQNSLAFTYDRADDKLTTHVSNTYGSWSFDYLDYSTQVLNIKGDQAYGYLSALNYLQFRITVYNTPSTELNFMDVTLDGYPLGDFEGNPGAGLDWMVTEYDLSAGFTLTGTLMVSGIATNSPELNKVEIFFGHTKYQGPLVTSLVVDPNPVGLGKSLQVNATLDDGSTGDALVASAEFTLDGGVTWQAMEAVDGAFDQSLEVVSSVTTSPADAGSYDLCVRGWDSDGHIGATSCIQYAVDGAGPITSDLLAALDPIELSQPLTITATISDTATGGSNIYLGEYSLDGGSSWFPMEAQDGNYDGQIEGVEAAFAAPSTEGAYEVCVRGQDVSGNTGSAVCVTFTVVVAKPDTPLIYMPLILRSNP